MSTAKQQRNVIWTPTERQAEFLAAPEREVLYGGSMGGGKTDCLLVCALIQVNNPKHRAIFFSQIVSAIALRNRAFARIVSSFGWNLQHPNVHLEVPKRREN